MALAGSFRSGFTWDAFLLDPLVFIQWFAVAAALLFWGRGAYCGWLCPFGALQELTNQIARALRVPQWQLPWGLHERLWPIKYMIFLGLFGLRWSRSRWPETYAEVEPFKTAIILKFVRDWPFVVFALVLLGVGLFVERFYCRYLCPLGAALAIPARMRMFDWLKRYKECGEPLPDLRQRMPGPGDPSDRRDQSQRVRELPALPGSLSVRGRNARSSSDKLKRRAKARLAPTANYQRGIARHPTRTQNQTLYLEEEERPMSDQENNLSVTRRGLLGATATGAVSGHRAGVGCNAE